MAKKLYMFKDPSNPKVYPNPVGMQQPAAPMTSVGMTDGVVDPGSAGDMSYAQQYLGGLSKGGLTPNVYDNTVKANNSNTNKLIQDTYLSPEDYNSLVQSAESVGPVQEQKQHLQDLEKLQAQTLSALPNQVDQSPVLNLIDTYTGSKMAQNYQRPMAPEARAKIMLDYGEKTKKDREALLKDTLGAARYMKSGTMMDQSLQNLILASQVGHKQPPSLGSGRGSALDDWKVVAEGQKINKGYLDDKKILDTLDTNLGRGDLQGFTTSLSLAARSLGGEKGVLTDKDAERVFPSVPGMTMAKLEAYVQNDPNVLLDRNMIKGFKQLTATARQRLKEKNLEALNTFKSALKQSDNFAGKAHLVDPYTNQIQADAGPAQEPTIADLIRQRIKDKATKK